MISEDGAMLAVRPAPMRLAASFLVPLAGDGPSPAARTGFVLPPTGTAAGVPGTPLSRIRPPPLPAGMVTGEAPAERGTYGARIYARAATAGVRIDGPERPVDLLV